MALSRLNDSSLDSPIQQLLDDFKKLVFDNNNTTGSDKPKLVAIYNNSNLKPLEKYNEILKWYSSAKDSPFKKKFMGLQNKFLKIDLDKNRSIKKLNATLEQKIEKYIDDINEINTGIKSQRIYLIKFAKIIQEIEKIIHQNKNNFENIISQIIKLIPKLEELSLVQDAKITEASNNTSRANIQVEKTGERIEKVLTDLHENIQQYQKQLKQNEINLTQEAKEDSFLTKIVKTANKTSLVTGARNIKHDRSLQKALGDYYQHIKENNINNRYEKIIGWASYWANYKKKQYSTFFKSEENEFYQLYKKCINPFTQAHKRLDEELKLESTSDEVSRITDKIDEAEKIYRREMMNRVQTLEQLRSSVNNSKKIITGLISDINTLQNEPRQILFIHGEVKGLSAFSPDILEAKSLAEDIINIGRYTPKKEIQALQQRFQLIKENKPTAKIIEETVENLILQVQIYGGSGKNFMFMGTDQAIKIIKEFDFGTPKQKSSLSDAITENAGKRNNTFRASEEQFVANLKRDLEVGDLGSILLTWREVDQNDEKQKNVTLLMKANQFLALQHHANPFNILKKFVDEVMLAQYQASTYKTTTIKEGFESLDWEIADMFVRIYGNENQNDFWATMVLPTFENKSESDNSIKPKNNRS